MIYIETNSTLPQVNLAFEEHFLMGPDLGEDIVMLWQNEPTVVIGAFQNTHSEINQAYIADNGIHVVRRITGGGAVYHDLGNLCFSFILHNDNPRDVNFSIFAQPVVKALEKLGIYAEASGRNDLTINGAKFSGNAMKIHRDRILFHGTLLYDSNIEILSKALKVSADKIESKGIKSVRSRVTNIKPHAKQDMDITEFKNTLKQLLFEGERLNEYEPAPEDMSAIFNLSEKKYKTWEWNYGNNPKASVVFSRRYPGGKIEANLELNKGVITGCKFTGDFLAYGEIKEIEARLAGVCHERKAIETALADLDINILFGSIKREEVIDCIMGVGV